MVTVYIVGFATPEVDSTVARSLAAVNFVPPRVGDDARL